MSAVSQAFESIYNSKIGQQNVICDVVEPLEKKLEQDHLMGTWFTIMHVDEAPFTHDKWMCGQTIYSKMDNRGSFMEHTVGQEESFGPHFGSHGEMYCPDNLKNGQCFVRYRNDEWLKSTIVDTDYENYAVTYRCLPQHGSYLSVMARTPELDDEFLENIMFKVMYKLPNFNFQTLIRDKQGYFRCNYITEDHRQTTHAGGMPHDPARAHQQADYEAHKFDPHYLQ